METREWQGKTGGLPWMQRTLIRWLSVIDQRIVYVVLVVVVPFYMLIGHKGYLSMYHFFHNVRRESWLKAFVHVYANHFRFGQVVVDRFAAFGGRTFKMDVPDEMWTMYSELANQEDGFVQVSCHMGNYELAGYVLRQPKKTIYPLVFLGETETIMQNRAKLFAAQGVEMVPVKQDMSHIFILNNALREGNVVSMPGDRVFGSPKSLSCRMFGHDVRFPIGPFQLSVLRGTRMVAVWVMKESFDTYKVHCFELKADETEKQRVQCQQLADAFARKMEEMIDLYPTQWFNYFEFFEQSSSD